MSLTLLVLAAGMGSRYGGLKQIDPVGPSGEFVLDYSVHDALWAGFDRVVFVIRRDFEEEFRRVVISRYEKTMDVDVVYQERKDLPEPHVCPPGREKPWGTGHAIWAARRAIETPFLVVNADDFYGMEAFSRIALFLKGAGGKGGLGMGMVAYPLRNTLSEHGAVSRGICDVTPDNLLKSVEEHTGIVRKDGHIEGTDTSGAVRALTGSEPVSMNFWAFTPEVFSQLEKCLCSFLDSGGKENPKSEFYIPSAVSEIIASGAAPASVIPTTGRWFGVTYREDREAVTATFSELVRQGLYKTPLWSHAS
ncbi:MAG: nucleotidyltransferase [Verrucomicrobia bacterium]|nr:nucleotidyltransferase [Verrucomicrobiota bacterium]